MIRHDNSVRCLEKSAETVVVSDEEHVLDVLQVFVVLKDHCSQHWN